MVDGGGGGVAVADGTEVLVVALEGRRPAAARIRPSQGHGNHVEEYFCCSKVLELRQNCQRNSYTKNMQKPNPKWLVIWHRFDFP
jgi:hypothetical protein